MRYGISAGALVVDGNKVLVVRHHEAGSYDFWVPPGGRLEDEESIFECAKREALEETGLTVRPDRVVYIQEFVEPGYHFCKFFIICASYNGEITLANKDEEEVFLVDAQFMTRDQLDKLTVYPPILKKQFWEDLKEGFPCARYLGLERL